MDTAGESGSPLIVILMLPDNHDDFISENEDLQHLDRLIKDQFEELLFVAEESLVGEPRPLP